MTLFEGGETETIASITAHYNNGDTANLALGVCTYSSDDESVATVAVGVVTTVADWRGSWFSNHHRKLHRRWDNQD
jgi:hypothetical protein